jgi:Zn-dependent peptidase ImmA (M78 family)
MNRKKIKSLVNALLEQYKLTSIPVDVNRLAKLMGAEIKSDDFDKAMSGFAYQKHGVKYIGVNSTELPERQRFTIAHELGHLYLHRRPVSYDPGTSVMMFRNGHSSDGTDIKEIEANRFAAELLMPEERVLADLKKRGGIDLLFGDNEQLIQELANKYGVSKPAMTIRLNTLYFS